MTRKKREASTENTQIMSFEPYSELSEVINRANKAGYPVDCLISTFVFATEELARVHDCKELIGLNYE